MQSTWRGSGLYVLSLSVVMIACANSTTPPPDTGRAADAGTSEGGMDGASGCAAPMMMCGATCIDTSTDSANCGACGHACPSGVTCAQGMCACHQPLVGCGGLCVNTMTDLGNCGACGNACPMGGMCVDGTCLAQCDPPHMVCINPIAGPDAGSVADAGPIDAGAQTQAVCSDPMTDPDNCGVCNVRCRGGAMCVGGRCQCPAGQSSCGGVCTDLTTVDHCGTCTNSCGPGGTCSSPDGGIDQCVACGPTYTRCGTQCVDLQTNASNCMTCGHLCAPGETCAGGTCVCMGTHADCGGVCTDIQNDPNNCGGCNSSCGLGGVCHAGVCACGAPYAQCSGTACTNTLTDPMNCGMCGHACTAPTQYCVMGACSMVQLYHGWTPPAALTNCSVTGYDSMAATNMGGMYPYNAGDSAQCRAWKLAATVCTTQPVSYGSSPINNWSCPTAGGFTDPAFGMFCSVPSQYACTDCYGLCNAMCEYNPLSLRNCMGVEANQM